MSRRRRSLLDRCVRLATAALVIGFAASAVIALAQEGQADIRHETVSARELGLREAYRLSIRCLSTTTGELIVAAIEDDSPTRAMHSADDPKVQRELRRGDVITHVDGRRLDTFEAYVRAMHASGGRPRLTIVGGDSGVADDWLVTASRELVRAQDLPAPDSSPRSDGVVRAILAAPTNDPTIGPAVGASLAKVRSFLESALPEDRREIVAVTGDACDANGVLLAVDRMHCRECDTLFVFIASLAAHDARYAANDPSEGQFFHLDQGDLLRRSLWQRMISRNPRLAVLVTDTGEPETMLTAQDEVATFEDATSPSRRVWAERLLGTVGRIDVGSASPERGGWFDAQQGGLFTRAWIEAANDEAGTGSWDGFFARVSRQADRAFRDRRPATSPKWENAEASSTRTYVLEATPDATLDHLPQGDR